MTELVSRSDGNAILASCLWLHGLFVHVSQKKHSEDEDEEDVKFCGEQASLKCSWNLFCSLVIHQSGQGSL